MVAAAAPPRSMWKVDPAAGPTRAINGVGGTSSGRRPGLNIFSVPVCGAIFGSFALCIVIICVHSFLARRRAVSDARRRFLRRIRDMPLSGWSADVRPPPPAATAPRLGVPPPPTTLPVDVPPAPPHSSLIGDCPVCLEPLRVGCGDVRVRAAHACGHVFHSHCIEPWLHQRGSCPVCRCSVNSNSTSSSSSNFTSNSTSTPISNTSSTSNSGPVDECPLCLEPLHVGGGGARAAHVCGHTFHSRCIEGWLCHGSYCPMCRCTVRCNESRP